MNPLSVAVTVLVLLILLRTIARILLEER